MIEAKAWRWFGTAGHMIVCSSCRFRLHTHVGNHCISTVGAYYPPGALDPVEIGHQRYYQTVAFHLDPGTDKVTCWTEIVSIGYNDCDEAEVGHFRICAEMARLVAI